MLARRELSLRRPFVRFSGVICPGVLTLETEK
jgi:hypothetical protein